MKVDNIGEYTNISAFVEGKLKAFSSSPQDFRALYGFMFSERNNILWERSVGYKIERQTYGECKDRIEKRAFTLRKLLKDFPENSLVGLCLENGPDWIELFWAILCCGNCPLLMNTRLGRDVLEEVLSNSKVVATISDSMSFSSLTISPEEIPEAETPIPELPMGSELLVMSSGTSTHVKLCSYSAKEIACQIQDSALIIQKCKPAQQHFRGQLKLLTFLPFCHIFGLVAVYLWFSFFSRTLVFLKDYAPKTILDTVRRHQVTHIFAVPLMWERTYNEVLRTIRERGDDVYRRYEKGMTLAPHLPYVLRKRLFHEIRENLFGESVQFCISGGGRIRPEVLRFFNGIGYWLSNGYGMSEIGITSVELSHSFSERCSGSIGTPLSSVKYRLENGILQVRGDSMARRIRKDGVWTERTAEWFSTGDLAEERKGKIFLLGRSDDLVIGPDGENLNPELLEPRIQIPDVKEVAILGGGDMPATVLASVPPWTGKEKAQTIKQKIAEAIYPATLRIVLTTSPLMELDDFKSSRAKLREKLRCGEINAFEPKEDQLKTDDPLLSQIQALMAISLGLEEENVSGSSDFFSELGGTSLDYLTFTTALEEELNVRLPFEGAPLRSAEAIAEYIREGIQHGS